MFPVLVCGVLVTACGPVVGMGADTGDADTTSTNDEGPPPPTTAPPPSDDDGPIDPNDDPRWDFGAGADSSGGIDDPGVIECAEFDPGRVYLRGTLSEGASYLDALTLPTDPTNFCVGFLNYPSSPRIRPTDGRVVFDDEWDGGGILEFTPDAIGWNRYGYWDYPPDPYGNDALLLATPCEQGLAIGALLLSPTDGRPWYECGGSWFDPDGVSVYPSSDPIGVAITTDGRLLVNEPNYGSPLYLVAPGEMPGPELELPRDVDAVVTGRVHEDGLWIVAVAVKEGRAFRWMLVGDTIVEEGEYGEIDLGSGWGYLYEGAIDANGDFFHMGTGVGDTSSDVIVQRRLAPDASEIIYSEAELPSTAVKIHISELFTGP